MMAMVLMLGALTSCILQNEDVKNVKNSGVLVVGITDYAPMDFEDENGNWIGFDADLANEFAESLGVKCRFVEIDWDNKVAELNTREIDLIWNGMTASDKLGKEIDFSTAYAKNAQVVVVKSGSSFTKNDIGTMTIAVEKGSAGAAVADEIATAKNVNKVTKQLDALSEVLAGTSDAALIDLTMAQSVLGKGIYEGLELLEGAQYGEEVFAVGLRQGSDLKAALDAFLAEKYEDGTMATLSAKYDNAIVINEAAFK